MSTIRLTSKDIGYIPGQLPPGPKNSILDVPGVHVGQNTVGKDGEDARKGATEVQEDQYGGGAGNKTNELVDEPQVDGLSKIEANDIKIIKNESIETLFRAASEATEEEILNFMIVGRDGRTGFKGCRLEGLPVDRVRELVKKYRVDIDDGSCLSSGEYLALQNKGVQLGKGRGSPRLPGVSSSGLNTLLDIYKGKYPKGLNTSGSGRVRMPLCHFIFQDVQHEESKNNPVHCPKRILSYHHNDYAAISDRGHAEYDFMTQQAYTMHSIVNHNHPQHDAQSLRDKVFTLSGWTSCWVYS
ncbi:hypothetical protein SS1G_03026 [Sclerotinia sclerotiorum 1980 UF-70]|uniref:Uncharacterized protein n=1 Tax=Sclerotinia sclerotiorum (strain ATCC 18683 / 1980 / Ss-1) TaxID=665079 RepID=A7ECI7_SCLS1|nr:hypothetical protein SS1G_03026 [Sclerotinia sclerotiorum 1980 UF-70]EDO00166.1 hypothetical protein SS1G_03026 [Sclerotinia sclerotiorum 1980 UF-70]